jgi:hypothetical protein
MLFSKLSHSVKTYIYHLCIQIGVKMTDLRVEELVKNLKASSC